MIDAIKFVGLDPRVRNKLKRKRLSASDGIERLLTKVSEFQSVTSNDVKSKSRHREIVTARQQFCWIMKKSYGNQMSLKRIGSFIGNKDHSTVIHAIKTVDDLMDTDKSYKRRFVDLVTDLKEDEYLRDIVKNVIIEI